MGKREDMLRVGLLRFGVSSTARILSRPTVQSAIRGQIRKMVNGTREKYPYSEIPEVERASERIVEIIRSRIGEPSCIAVDGVSGAGKSTLSRSLASRFGIGCSTLRTRDMNEPVELNKGMVYENVRLLRTQDIDHFDAIIYLDIPIAVARKRVLDRDRNGALVDFLDFEVLKSLGDMAFDAAHGDAIAVPDSYIKLKTRPPHGFRHEENLSKMLAAAGLRTTGLCKEEMLFLYRYGKATKGIMPYLKLGAYNRDLLVGVLEGMFAALRMLT